MSSQADPSSRTSVSSVYSALSRPGWLTFAAVVLFSVGCLRVISALYYFADSNRLADLTFGAVGGNLFLWGLWDLGIAALAFMAGWSLLSNHRLGRVLGYAWAVFVIVQSFMIVSYAPWFGFAAIVLAILVLLALSTTSGWTENAQKTPG